MGVHIENNKLVIITEQKNFDFDVPKSVHKKLNHVIDYITQYNSFLAKDTKENKIS